MKLIFGMPPKATLQIAEATRLHQDFSRLHLAALVFGIVVVAPLLLAAWVLRWGWAPVREVGDLGPGIFIPMMIAVIAVHECLHVLGHPKFGFSSSSYIGFVPKHGLFFASYNGVISRGRFIVMALMPWLVLTVLPYLLYPYAPLAWRALLAQVSLSNGLAAAGDLFIVLKVLWRIPAGALVQGEWYGQRLKEAAV